MHTDEHVLGDVAFLPGTSVETRTCLAIDRVDLGIYAERERPDLWREIAAPFFDVELDEAPATPFGGTVTTLSFGDVIVVHSALSGQRYARDAARARTGPWDQIAFQLYCSGSFKGDYDGREVAGGRGDVNVIDFTRPYAKASTDEADINLILPRPLVGRLCPGAMHGGGRSGETAVGRLLGLHLRMLVASAAQLTVEEAEGVVRGFLLVMEGGRLDGEAPMARAGLRATARARAESFVRANLLHANLDADAIARGCGLSRAALYRLFTADGGVRSFIQRERLCLAVERARRRPAANLGAVAEGCGLGGRAEFAKLYRRHTGGALDDVRERGPEGAAPRATPELWLSTLRRMREAA